MNVLLFKAPQSGEFLQVVSLRPRPQSRSNPHSILLIVDIINSKNTKLTTSKNSMNDDE